MYYPATLLLLLALLCPSLTQASGELTPPNDSLNAAMTRMISLNRSALTLDFNSRSSLLAVGGQGPSVQLINPQLGNIVKTIDGVHTDDILSVAFSPDDRLLATGSADNLVVIWDVASSRPLRILKAHRDYISGLDWSADGEVLASAAWDGRVIFWEPGTGKKLREIDPLDDKATGVAFDPMGGQIATSSADGTVRIYELDSLTMIRELESHKDDITVLRWSERSSLLATGSWDNTASVWNPRSGKQVGKLTGHTTDVNCLSFSPDGTVLATSGGDRTLKLWDLPTGKEITDVTDRAHAADVEDIVFNHNGNQLATCSRDGTVKIWKVPSLEERLAAAIVTGMEEWKVKGPYEKTSDYEKRMKRGVRQADELRQELEGELALFYEENVDWRSDLTFRTYNADREYFPLTSPIFGSLKVEVSNEDAPLVAENLDKLTFENLSLRVKKGKMQLRRFTAKIEGEDSKKFKVTPF